MRLLAGAACALLLAAPAAARADDDAAPRTARVSSGVDPALAYDLAGVQVALAPATGALTVAIDLHAPLPAPAPAAEQAAVTIALAAAAAPLPGDASGDRCQPTGTSAGDAAMTVAAAPSAAAPPAETAATADEPPAPELTATASIAPEPLPRTVPVTLSLDRRRLTAVLADPLLDGAAPRCLVVRAHGLAVGAPAEASDAEELSAWFDGQRPPVGGPGDPPPAPAPPSPPSGGGGPATPGDSTPSPRRCSPRRPAGLTWGAFPRELAVGGSALVPVQARDGRDVRDVVAALTTFAGRRKVGPPLLVALPPLSPLGETPGLWRYRVSAVSGERTLLRGDLLIEVAERDGAIVRTIRLRRD